MFADWMLCALPQALGPLLEVEVATVCWGCARDLRLLHLGIWWFDSPLGRLLGGLFYHSGAGGMGEKAPTPYPYPIAQPPSPRGVSVTADPAT